MAHKKIPYGFCVVCGHYGDDCTGDNTDLVVRKFAESPSVEVILNIQNEGHEMPYAERFEGTPEKIVERSRNIVRRLSRLFPQGSWSVKIESVLDWDYITINDSGVWDSNWNSILD